MTPVVSYAPQYDDYPGGQQVFCGSGGTDAGRACIAAAA
jgi:hypothetical protein